MQEIFLGEERIKNTKIKQFLPVGELIRNTEIARAVEGEYSVKTTIYYGDTLTDTKETRFMITAEGEEIPLAAGVWVILVAATILTLIVLKRKRTL